MKKIWQGSSLKPVFIIFILNTTYLLKVPVLKMLLLVSRMIRIARYDYDGAFLSKQRPWFSQKSCIFILTRLRVTECLALKETEDGIFLWEIVKVRWVLSSPRLKRKALEWFSPSFPLASQPWQCLPWPACWIGAKSTRETVGGGGRWGEGQEETAWEQGKPPKSRSGKPYSQTQASPLTIPNPLPSHHFQLWKEISNIWGKVRPNILEFERHKSGFTIHWLSFAKLWKIINHSIMEKKNHFSLASAQRISTVSSRIQNW